MNNHTEKKVSRPPQITVVLRLVAGVYLMYLSYGLLQDFLVPAGSRKMLQGICMILFFAAGAVISIWSGKKLLRGEFLRYGQLPDDEDES